MIPLVDQIYESGVVLDAHDQSYQLRANIDRGEGDFVRKLIESDASIKKTAEVGCAYGLASLHIAGALRDRDGSLHTIIDPFQLTQWRGIGLANLERAGIGKVEFIEAKSEFALPKLAESQPGAFDLVFIDGCHTFDHTLLDMFYANRMLRVGGYIVVDDCVMAPIAKAVSYVANYPCYKLHSQSQGDGDTTQRKLAKLAFNAIPQALRRLAPKQVYDALHRARYSSMVALQKVSADDRHWCWFRDF